MIMNIYDIIKNRRSVRQYKPDPVPREILQRVLDAANWAPSGMNMQQWEFIVVTGATKNQLSDSFYMVAQAYSAKMDDESRKKMYLEFAATYGGAPLIIAILAPKTEKESMQKMHLQSISAALQNLLLAAWAEGLGSCWMTGPLADEPGIRSILDIAEDKEIVALTPIGYPAVIPPAPSRIDPELKTKVKWVD